MLPKVIIKLRASRPTAKRLSTRKYRVADAIGPQISWEPNLRVQKNLSGLINYPQKPARSRPFKSTPTRKKISYESERTFLLWHDGRRCREYRLKPSTTGKSSRVPSLSHLSFPLMAILKSSSAPADTPRNVPPSLARLTITDPQLIHARAKRSVHAHTTLWNLSISVEGELATDHLIFGRNRFDHGNEQRF